MLTVNGLDLTQYIASQGFKWQRSDVDGPNTGRSIENGYLYRDRLAVKIRLDITCRLLTTKEAATVLQAIEPEYVIVTYLDPQTGEKVTKEMYSNNIPASVSFMRNGEVYWGGITFPLIER